MPRTAAAPSADAGEDAAPFRVAYVAYSFPVLTQTFTTREVLALRERGLDVHVFAARADADAALDAEGRRAQRFTTYLPRAASGAALRACAASALRRPARFLATLAACAGGGYTDQPLRSRVRSLRHFVLGVALAARLRGDGAPRRVHAQFVDAGSTVAFVAARLLDVPFSFTNHTAYNPFLLRPKARAADLLLSISEFDRARVAAAVPEAAARIAVARVGIRIEEFADLPRRPERGRLLAVGALREKKGHDVLVRAAGELARGGERVTVVVAGEGAERERLAALAAQLGVELELLGAVGPERVREELVRAEAFVLACRVAANGDLDGIPVALMEAMAAGVPVVSTRLSGVPELVEDGLSGYLAAVDDAPDLARTLTRCLADARSGRATTDAARRRVAGLHDLRRTSERLAALLRREAPPR